MTTTNETLVKITIQKRSASTMLDNQMIVKETTSTELFGNIVCELEVTEAFKLKLIDLSESVFVENDKRYKDGFRFEDGEGNIIN